MTTKIILIINLINSIKTKKEGRKKKKERSINLVIMFLISHFIVYSGRRLISPNEPPLGKGQKFWGSGKNLPAAIKVHCLPDLTNSVLTNHPGIMNRFLTSNIFLLHKNIGFSEFPGLMNSCLGPNRFVKSGSIAK